MREARSSRASSRRHATTWSAFFPLRFEVPAQVAAALAGLVIHELPDDELDRYRPAVAAVSAAEHVGRRPPAIRPSDMSVVCGGDASKVEGALRELNLAPLTVVAADAESVIVVVGRPGLDENDQLDRPAA
jgi:hypothetical protein